MTERQRAPHNWDEHGTLLALLRHLYRAGTSAYWWNSATKQSTWFKVGELIAPPSGTGAYFSVHPSTMARGPYDRARIQDVAAINCLYADVDAKQFDQDDRANGLALARQHIQSLRPQPSVIVETGGGYHCYWLLNEPYVLDTAERRERARLLQAQWNRFVGGDPDAKDLARVLRVPGSRNHKYPDKPLVAFRRCELDVVYRFEELESLVGLSCNRDANSQLSTAQLLLRKAEFRLTSHGRNETGFWLACQLRDASVPWEASAAVMVEYATRVPARDHSYTVNEALASLAQAYSRPARQFPELVIKSDGRDDFHFTDMGNAQRLVAQHGRDLRYCHAWSAWLVWDGQRWRRDETGEIMRRAKATVRHIYQEAGDCEDAGRRKELSKHAAKSEAAVRLREMTTLAESEPGMPVTPDQLDTDPWLFNVRNGTVDLRTGELQPHRRDDLITKLAPVAYEPQASCPQWEAFLLRIMDGSEALVSFLQRAIGYSLTGVVSERALFILYGTGANGKSTLLLALQGLLGDYAMRTPTETLLAKRGDGIPNDVARLKGSRFVYSSEGEDGRRLAEAKVKDLTGGDVISARFMRAEWFEFTPEFKLWLGTNYKPTVRGNDHGIWDRIKLVPFSVRIPEDQQAPRHELLARFERERAGILAWAVLGCLAWQREGLGVPPEVTAATETYRTEMDVLGAFIADCCVERHGAVSTAADLYEAYKVWSDRNGEHVLAQRAFGLKLKERNFEPLKGTGGRRQWRGIGLLANNHGQDPAISLHQSTMPAVAQVAHSGTRLRIAENSIYFHETIPSSTPSHATCATQIELSLEERLARADGPDSQFGLQALEQARSCAVEPAYDTASWMVDDELRGMVLEEIAKIKQVSYIAAGRCPGRRRS